MTKKPQHPENDPENQPAADERNIVAVDTTYEGASFEDRLFLFWNEYKKPVISVIVVIVLALAGWGIISFVQIRQEARIATEYGEAASVEDLRAFAARNSPHPLAGVAFLEVADDSFSNEEYEEAAGYYERAAENLGDIPPAGRAEIGEGVSLAMAGNQDEALAHFEQVARDAENFEIVRAEAYYHAATLAIETGQNETARDHIDQVIEMDRSQIWAGRAMRLQQALPDELQESEATPPGGGAGAGPVAVQP